MLMDIDDDTDGESRRLENIHAFVASVNTSGFRISITLVKTLHAMMAMYQPSHDGLAAEGVNPLLHDLCCIRVRLTIFWLFSVMV